MLVVLVTLQLLHSLEKLRNFPFSNFLGFVKLQKLLGLTNCFATDPRDAL